MGIRSKYVDYGISREAHRQNFDRFVKSYAITGTQSRFCYKHLVQPDHSCTGICFRYQSHNLNHAAKKVIDQSNDLSFHMFDHEEIWTADTGVVVTSQPYNFTHEEKQILDRFCQQLSITYEILPQTEGWYNFKTYLVVIKGRRLRLDEHIYFCPRHWILKSKGDKYACDIEGCSFSIPICSFCDAGAPISIRNGDLRYYCRKHMRDDPVLIKQLRKIRSILKFQDVVIDFTLDRANAVVFNGNYLPISMELSGYDLSSIDLSHTIFSALQF